MSKGPKLLAYQMAADKLVERLTFMTGQPATFNLPGDLVSDCQADVATYMAAYKALEDDLVAQTAAEMDATLAERAGGAQSPDALTRADARAGDE